MYLYLFNAGELFEAKKQADKELKESRIEVMVLKDKLRTANNKLESKSV